MYSALLQQREGELVFARALSAAWVGGLWNAARGSESGAGVRGPRSSTRAQCWLSQAVLPQSLVTAQAPSEHSLHNTVPRQTPWKQSAFQCCTKAPTDFRRSSCAAGETMGGWWSLPAAERWWGSPATSFWHARRVSHPELGIRFHCSLPLYALGKHARAQRPCPASCGRRGEQGCSPVGCSPLGWQGALPNARFYWADLAAIQTLYLLSLHVATKTVSEYNVTK